ncbi:MAG: glycoside hydrolase family 3 protein [Gammaproteobacteria bacterium]|nr:glycoside hydrolase family 3 protein [Gammaproteobacteria bacterium]
MISTLFRHLFFISLCTLAINVYSAEKNIPLRDKIGQMIMLGVDERKITSDAQIVHDIENLNIGGVIFSIDDMALTSEEKTPLTLAEIKHITQQLQTFTRKSAQKHHREFLPLFIATDEEGGRIDRFRTVDGVEPTLPAGLYSRLTKEKRAHEINKLVHNLVLTGFNLDLAPVVDINVNPHNPIIGRLERSYSDNPETVVNYASEVAQGLNQHHIQCAYKHFPGHGSGADDSHMGFVDVTKTWQAYELYPYQLLLSKPKSCQFVMTAHIVNKQLDPSGLPATLSHAMLTNLLRQHLHFKGVIISDDMQMKAISDHYTPGQAITLAINAGVDVLLYAERKKFPFKTVSELIDLIESKVKSGDIPQKNIDDAYARIIRLKHTLRHE